jgi:two-component system, cell cycle response regulator DivK
MASSNPPPYILIVDDHPDGREMLTEYLRFRGFEVLDAPNGETALEHALNRPPAVILMDLQMPGMGGWEATRQLKAHPQTRHVLVIALTAHALAPDEKIARQAGCDAFVAKPFDMVAFGDAITQVMHRGRAGLAAIDALAPLRGNAVKHRRTART